jgi:phosphoheptose isomerase
MSFPEQYRNELLKAIESIDLTKVDQAIEWFRESRDTGRHIFVCGNGGSAATASHFACDIVKGCSYKRDKRFRIMALTDQLPTITAYSNDVGYDVIFAEQLKNFAAAGRPVHGHQRFRQFPQCVGGDGLRQLHRLPHHRLDGPRRRKTRDPRPS